MRTTGAKMGEHIPDNLVAGAFPPLDAFAIELEEKGVIERGTVMQRESDGKYSVLAAGGTASCVIAETTEADDTYAQAYRSGNFYRNNLIVDDSYELTADDENNLRLAGIYLTDGI